MWNIKVVNMKRIICRSSDDDTSQFNEFPMCKHAKVKLRQQWAKYTFKYLSNRLWCSKSVCSLRSVMTRGSLPNTTPADDIVRICVTRFQQQERAKHKTHLGLIRGDPFAQAIRHNVISANRVAAIPGLILSNYIFYCCNTHPEMGKTC